MKSSLSSESMVFDRADLRVLRLAYAQAIEMLCRGRSLDVLQRTRVGKLVIEAARARNRRGAALLGAETLIAREAVALLDTRVSLALCA